MRVVDVVGVARQLARPASRRAALIAASLLVVGTGGEALARKTRRSNSSVLRKKRRKAEQRGSRKNGGSNKDNGSAFPRDCRRFTLSAGDDPDDKFRHVDDDVTIELIPKGKNGQIKVLLKDDNNSPNGVNGAHLKITPFTAKVGDRIHVVARNEVTGGCELDEIWIHCVEGRGGKVKLADAVTPEECRRDAANVGVFVDRTFRIRNT